MNVGAEILKEIGINIMPSPYELKFGREHSIWPELICSQRLIPNIEYNIASWFIMAYSGKHVVGTSSTIQIQNWNWATCQCP